ncbi:MAG: fluoride efflux transporter CrcB [Actinomycetaceae bacterium]|nr:fluoride efflux transporter CrcB [Actinomycetaceae bacterium]
MNVLFVGIGGFIGAALRYLISLIPLPNTHGFPLATLVINTLGAFVLGLLIAFEARHPEMDARILLMSKVGICGGFTTFSTFSLEAQNLLATGKTAMAISYMVASLVLTILAVWLPQR